MSTRSFLKQIPWRKTAGYRLAALWWKNLWKRYCAKSLEKLKFARFAASFIRHLKAPPPPAVGGEGVVFSGRRSVRPLTPISRDMISLYSGFVQTLEKYGKSWNWGGRQCPDPILGRDYWPPPLLDPWLCLCQSDTAGFWCEGAAFVR